MDALISGLMVGAASLIGWAVTQASARTKEQRAELRFRRRADLLRLRYVTRLEEVFARQDWPLPDKPEGYDEIDEAEW